MLGNATHVGHIMCQHGLGILCEDGGVDPETERLVDEAVKARLRWMVVQEQAEQLKNDYRNALSKAVETRVRGVKIAIARGAGVSDEIIRLDANPQARETRAAARRAGSRTGVTEAEE